MSGATPSPICKSLLGLGVVLVVLLTGCIRLGRTRPAPLFDVASVAGHYVFVNSKDPPNGESNSKLDLLSDGTYKMDAPMSEGKGNWWIEGDRLFRKVDGEDAPWWRITRVKGKFALMPSERDSSVYFLRTDKN